MVRKQVRKMSIKWKVALIPSNLEEVGMTCEYDPVSPEECGCPGCFCYIHVLCDGVSRVLLLDVAEDGHAAAANLTAIA